MNALERHGIDHLSASSLNLWRASPGLWSARYLAGLKDDANAAMWRGTAVEAGLRHVLYGAPIEEKPAKRPSRASRPTRLARAMPMSRLVLRMLDRAVTWKPSS